MWKFAFFVILMFFGNTSRFIVILFFYVPSMTISKQPFPRRTIFKDIRKVWQKSMTIEYDNHVKCDYREKLSR